MTALLEAVQGSALAVLLRDSPLLYPVANIAHVLAVMAFFAAVTVMDMRLLQVIRGVPIATVVARMRPLAIGALAVVVASGLLLFVPDAAAIGTNPAFLLKLVAIVLGLLNVAANQRALLVGGEAAPAVRATAGLSLALWLAVAALGRLIAYV